MINSRTPPRCWTRSTSSRSAPPPSTRFAARVQQDTLGHRGRKSDPLYEIQNILRAGAENLTDKQRARLVAAIDADPAHEEVFIAWQAAQELRSAYRAKDLAEGQRIAVKVLDSFASCPIPEIARLGRTLRR